MVVLNLEVNDIFEIPSSASICEGESYWFNGEELTTSGTYEAMLSTTHGCDSLLKLELTVFEKETSNKEAQICESSEYDFYGEILTVEGDYEMVLSNMNGCDSTVFLHLEVTDVLSEFIAAKTCPGESYPFGGQLLTEPGNYEMTVTSSGGCDSVVSLTLGHFQAYFLERATSICYGDSAELDGIFYHETGDYSSSLSSINGCDSTTVLYLIVLDSMGSEFSEMICENEVYDFYGEMLEQAGTYEAVLLSTEGCDSTVTLFLDVEPIYVDTLEEYVVTGSFYNGVQIFEDTIFTENLIAQNGCDSLVSTLVIPFTNTNENLADAIGLSIFPNPTDGRFFIQFDLSGRQNVEVEIMDVIGQRVAFASQKNNLSAGRHVLEVPNMGWPSGVYLVHFQTDSGLVTDRVVVD